MKYKMELSVALFAYNQERYIREAVCSILSQVTATPLEIIFSDDSSMDDTYSIMQKEVSAYEGPHKVIVRSNDTNLGLEEHINTVLDICSSPWVMMAAGDDVSLGGRCENLMRLIREVKAEEVMAIQGGYYETGPDGKIGECFADPFLPSGDLKQYVESNGCIVGATMTYNMHLVRRFGHLQPGVRYEDRIFGFRAMMLGSIMNHPEPLVHYRRDVPTSLSTGNRLGRSLNDQVIFRAKRFSALKSVAIQYLIDMEAIEYRDENLRIIIESKILEYSFFQSIYEKRPLRALKYLFRCRKARVSLKRPLPWLIRSVYYKARSLSATVW